MTKYLLFLCLAAFSAQSAAIKLQATCNIESAYNVNYFSISYLEDNRARIEVNSNQIYITANVTDTEQGYRNFYFHQIDSVGLAGATIDWQNISKTEPILRINKLNNRDYVIDWFGFYDETSGKYIWNTIGSKGPDLYAKTSVIRNCEFY